MKHKKTILLMLATCILMLLRPSVYADTMINYLNTTTADIALFRSDDPIQYSHHTIQLISSTTGSRIVRFKYDRTSFTTYCDGTWRDFGTAPDLEIQNKISCTMDQSSVTSSASHVYVSLTIYDQKVYAYPYNEKPDVRIDTHLKGTTVDSPYCVHDDLIVPATFCKWEKQNLNDPLLMSKSVPLNAWVVYGMTTVANLPLSNVTAEDPQYPIADGDQVCVADLNGDGLVRTDEMAKCLETPEGFLCPFKKTTCNGSCPFGSSHICMTYNSLSQCSPYTCREFTEATSIQSTDTTQGGTDKKDDGVIDQTGKCLGQIYIFSGKDKRCRPDGIETGYFDCCGGSDVWFDVGGQPINPFLPPAGSIIADKIFQCKEEEKELIVLNQKGLCHYVGSYCSLNIFGLCLQRKKTYCCFNSKLGRILQEQGRPTLQAFSRNRWGSAKAPNCRGFSPEEFQMLDFTKIDLSSWYGDIQVNTQQQITNTMQNKIDRAYGNIQ